MEQQIFLRLQNFEERSYCLKYFTNITSVRTCIICGRPLGTRRLIITVTVVRLNTKLLGNIAEVYRVLRDVASVKEWMEGVWNYATGLGMPVFSHDNFF